MDWRSSPECTELMPPMDDFSNSLLAMLMVLGWLVYSVSQRQVRLYPSRMTSSSQATKA
jgi:hypothetical protein